MKLLGSKVSAIAAVRATSGGKRGRRSMAVASTSLPRGVAGFLASCPPPSCSVAQISCERAFERRSWELPILPGISGGPTRASPPARCDTRCDARDNK
eukprot:scaffold187676_cov26-Tisochrysis_lutea.AAC.3